MLLMVALQAEQCGTCHPADRVEHEISIHRRASVGCRSCHGGNPDTLSVDAAHVGDFRGSPSRSDIPALCASCHADPEVMRPYNLPTDQYVLYGTSAHGRGLARGDTRVAVCTDCHGTHDILAPDNPASRVFQHNIPRTCGRCHDDAALLARYGREPGVLRDYLQSVHGRQLLEEGNSAAPECSRCHGVHSASPPGIGNVGTVCGSCHSAALRAFQNGPHSAFSEAGLPECVSCHDNHATESAPAALVQVCSNCHGEGSPQLAVGERLAVLFQRAEEETEKAREMILEAAQIPIHVEDYEARLQVARTYLVEAGPAAHAVSVEVVEGFTRPARSIGEEIQAEIQGELSEQRVRRVGLIVFWFYLLTTVWILVRLRRDSSVEVRK